MTFQENMVSQVVVACRGCYKYRELFAGLTGLFRGGTGGGVTGWGWARSWVRVTCYVKGLSGHAVLLGFLVLTIFEKARLKISMLSCEEAEASNGQHHRVVWILLQHKGRWTPGSFLFTVMALCFKGMLSPRIPGTLLLHNQAP